MKKNTVVYSDQRYVLGMGDELPYLTVAGRNYRLTCHPYEPCLYITDEKGLLTAVHNAFDPDSVLALFAKGQTVTSITGREYDALDFCRMVEYAAGLVNIQIDEAEQVFGSRPKKKHPEPVQDQKREAAGGEQYRPESGRIIEKDPFYDILEAYPDCVVDFCLVKNDQDRGYTAHWKALLWASRKLFIDIDDEVIWHFDVGKADGKPVSADALFAPLPENGPLNYRKAFLFPPYPHSYTEKDFDRINRVLFPNGTDCLEVYQWSTNWSEYFDEGHEWWGTLCLTVYDKSLDRFVVILASATD